MSLHPRKQDLSQRGSLYLSHGIAAVVNPIFNACLQSRSHRTDDPVFSTDRLLEGCRRTCCSESRLMKTRGSVEAASELSSPGEHTRIERLRMDVRTYAEPKIKMTLPLVRCSSWQLYCETFECLLKSLSRRRQPPRNVNTPNMSIAKA